MGKLKPWCFAIEYASVAVNASNMEVAAWQP